MSSNNIEEIKDLLWGSDVKHEVFRRWTQGLTFSEEESTALVQHEGGPCSVIAPIQAFFLKNLLFRSSPKEDWRTVTNETRNEVLVLSLQDMFLQASPSESYTLVYLQSDQVTSDVGQSVSTEKEEEEGTSSCKKQCFSHEQFHSGLRCKSCNSVEELHNHLQNTISVISEQYGVLLILYSLILTKGIEQLKNEVEDPNQPLIDGTYGHGSQSLINLLLTGRAVSNVWDNDKDVSGLLLKGINKQSQVGFLTLLEHLRFLEVGWYLKNPQYPVWLLGSETHVTVLFSLDRNIVAAESPDAAARRMFNTIDSEARGFISGDLLGDLLSSLDLVSEPEYVKIMQEKMDPEQLGIITLNTFMEEFFPSDPNQETILTFQLYHYNGLPRSCPDNKVIYREGEASIMEYPEVQIITDTSEIKTCLMTKWPTIELKWTTGSHPSLN